MKNLSVKMIKRVPLYVRKILDEYYCGQNEQDWIIVGHKNKWDGGYICKNGYISTREEFYFDTNQMIEVICDLTNSMGFEEIKIFAIDNSFFEDKLDTMTFEIVIDIISWFKVNGIKYKECQGVILNVHNDLVKLFIAGAFNYLVRCVVVIGEKIVILPTHNFELNIYCKMERKKIIDSVKHYDFLDVYE